MIILIGNIRIEKRFRSPEENEDLNKKIERAKRFGLVEKDGGSIKNNVPESSEAALNQRKERFKQQFEEDEKEKEKDKDKDKDNKVGYRGRIRRDYKNNYRNNRRYIGGNRSHNLERLL